MLTTHSKLKLGKNLYTVNDVPLGVLKKDMFGTTVIVPDARGILVNGEMIDWTVSPNNNLVIVGTDSPQHIKGIDTIIQNATK